MRKLLKDKAHGLRMITVVLANHPSNAILFLPSHPKRSLRDARIGITHFALRGYAALAASPEVEAALKAFQTAGADANRLKTFCELMQVDQQNALKADPLLEAKMDKLLDELGADFKAAWETVDDIQLPSLADTGSQFVKTDKELDNASSRYRARGPTRLESAAEGERPKRGKGSEPSPAHLRISKASASSFCFWPA